MKFTDGLYKSISCLILNFSFSLLIVWPTFLVLYCFAKHAILFEVSHAVFLDASMPPIRNFYWIVSAFTRTYTNGTLDAGTFSLIFDAPSLDWVIPSVINQVTHDNSFIINSCAMFVHSWICVCTLNLGW